MSKSISVLLAAIGCFTLNVMYNALQQQSDIRHYDNPNRSILSGLMAAQKLPGQVKFRLDKKLDQERARCNARPSELVPLTKQPEHASRLKVKQCKQETANPKLTHEEMEQNRNFKGIKAAIRPAVAARVEEDEADEESEELPGILLDQKAEVELELKELDVEEAEFKELEGDSELLAVYPGGFTAQRERLQATLEQLELRISGADEAY